MFTAKPPQLEATFFKARVFKLISVRSDLWQGGAKAAGSQVDTA
jgi:hypothetical protein